MAQLRGANHGTAEVGRRCFALDDPHAAHHPAQRKDPATTAAFRSARAHVGRGRRAIPALTRMCIMTGSDGRWLGSVTQHDADTDTAAPSRAR
jgi:hypothetical protein